MGGDGVARGAGEVVASVIDVVDSRGHRDQAALLRGVADRAQQVLVDEGAAVSAGASVGDEFQALHSHVGDAVLDLARLRLSLLVAPPVARPVEVRVGIGVGEVIGDGHAAAPSQSGTAWWRAREALDRAATQRNGWPPTRWSAVGGDEALPACLVALDTLLARLDDDDRRAALALLDGTTARAVADDLGVAPSTLSARLHGHGVYGVVRTLELLAERGGAPAGPDRAAGEASRPTNVTTSVTTGGTTGGPTSGPTVAGGGR